MGSGTSQPSPNGGTEHTAPRKAQTKMKKFVVVMTRGELSPHEVWSPLHHRELASPPLLALPINHLLPPTSLTTSPTPTKSRTSGRHSPAFAIDGNCEDFQNAMSVGGVRSICASPCATSNISGLSEAMREWSTTNFLALHGPIITSNDSSIVPSNDPSPPPVLAGSLSNQLWSPAAGRPLRDKKDVFPAPNNTITTTKTQHQYDSFISTLSDSPTLWCLPRRGGDDDVCSGASSPVKCSVTLAPSTEESNT